MIDRYEAHKLLVHAGYQIDMQSSYRVPVVLEAKHEDVKRFLTEHGYEGMFITTRGVKTKLDRK